MKLQEYLDLSKQQQREFSKVLGYDESIVSRWVRGERTPSKSNIVKIHNYTKGAVTWLDWNIPQNNLNGG